MESIPIVVVIIPIFMPLLIGLQIDIMWFAILVAVTLQSCWLSPPVALSVYYIKGVMPDWDLTLIYSSMIPFMSLQLIAVLVLYFFPQKTIWLPNLIFGH